MPRTPGSFFVWVSAERTILSAFRDPEVTRELYLASECSSQRRYRGLYEVKAVGQSSGGEVWWTGALVGTGGVVGGVGDGVRLVSEGRMGVVRGEMRCG